MKVLYRGQEKEITDLREGVYLPFSERFKFPTGPLIEKDKLRARITQLGYDQDNGSVRVIGPFENLKNIKSN